LLGLGGVLFFSLNGRAQEEVAVTPSPTPFPPTFTPTPTPTLTPTNTPEPTPTPTSVVGGQAGDDEPAGEDQIPEPVDTPTVDAEATPTNTRVLQTPTATSTPVPDATATAPPAVVPDSGAVLTLVNRGFLLWLGGGLLLVMLIYGTIHRYKSSG